MGWIVFGLIFLFVLKRFVGSGGNDQDDFAGNSVKSYFFLEEFIDESSGKEDFFDQDEMYYEVDEFDWFEEGE